jgi:hypothetical protein
MIGSEYITTFEKTENGIEIMDIKSKDQITTNKLYAIPKEQE